MVSQPVVTGLSPKEGPPGTRIVIRGESLGKSPSDVVGLAICGCDCLLSAEWKSPNKIIAHTGPGKGKGDVIVTTVSGGVGTSTVKFRAYHETIGPTKESAVWVEETTTQNRNFGRRNITPAVYTQENPLGLSMEGNEKKFPEDIRDFYPAQNGDLSLESFAPGWFLLENHYATSFDDLKAGLAYIKRKVESQKEGQLSFLKSNTGSVLNQINTLLNIRSKFSEDDSCQTDRMLNNLQLTIQRSIDISVTIFQDILERTDRADKTRAVLTSLHRYKFLFCLPNSIDRCAEAEEYDAIVNDYLRARNLFGKVDIPILHKALNEVDVRVAKIHDDLQLRILHLPQSVEYQKTLIKILNCLEVGTPEKKLSFYGDPAWNAIEARAKYLEASFLKSYNAYFNNDMNPEESQNRILFCEEICQVAVCQIPDIWCLGQFYFSSEFTVNHGARAADFKKLVLRGVDIMCSMLKRVIFSDFQTAGPMFPVDWPDITTISLTQYAVCLPECISLIRMTYLSLVQLSLPSEILDIIFKLKDEVEILCFSAFLKTATEKIKTLNKSEKWEFFGDEFPGVTLLPSLLEKTVVETLENIQKACGSSETKNEDMMENSSKKFLEVIERVKEIYASFCLAIDTLAYQLDEEDSHTPVVSQLIGFSNFYKNAHCRFSVLSWEQRMLCCLANCLYCEQIFFSHIGSIFAKFGYPVPQAAIEIGKLQAKKLFYSLLETYVEHKSDPLVGTIEPSMYIGHFQWNAIQEVDTLRPYVQECYDNLVGVYSEIFCISQLLLHPILEPIVQTIAEELARLMSCVENFDTKGRIQANIDVRFIRDTLGVYCNKVAKIYFQEALDVIGPISDTEKIIIEDALTVIKKRMNIQLSCFCLE